MNRSELSPSAVFVSTSHPVRPAGNVPLQCTGCWCGPRTVKGACHARLTVTELSPVIGHHRTADSCSPNR